MKISLALGPRPPLNRQTAWGCLTTNLAVPGFGSLIAGRRAGYPQAIAGLVGLMLTLVFGLRFVIWFLQNWARIRDPLADPVETLNALWLAVRWALLGIGLFAAAWFWALGSSLSILRAARRAEAAKAPPPLLP